MAKEGHLSVVGFSWLKAQQQAALQNPNLLNSTESPNQNHSYWVNNVYIDLVFLIGDRCVIFAIPNI